MARTKGFSVVEGVLILVVVAVIGFVGYLAYTNFLAPSDDTDSNNTADSSQQEEKPVVVESTDDLDNAISELDNVSIDDDSEGAELEKASDEFSS